MDNPARIRDNVTADLTRGRMTRSEAIRYIVEAGKEAHYVNPTLGQDRTEEALARLGISPGSIQKAKDLP